MDSLKFRLSVDFWSLDWALEIQRPTTKTRLTWHLDLRWPSVVKRCRKRDFRGLQGDQRALEVWNVEFWSVWEFPKPGSSCAEAQDVHGQGRINHILGTRIRPFCSILHEPFKRMQMAVEGISTQLIKVCQRNDNGISMISNCIHIYIYIWNFCISIEGVKSVCDYLHPTFTVHKTTLKSNEQVRDAIKAQRTTNCTTFFGCSVVCWGNLPHSRPVVFQSLATRKTWDANWTVRTAKIWFQTAIEFDSLMGYWTIKCNEIHVKL